MFLKAAITLNVEFLRHLLRWLLYAKGAGTSTVWILSGSGY